MQREQAPEKKLAKLRDKSPLEHYQGLQKRKDMGTAIRKTYKVEDADMGTEKKGGRSFSDIITEKLKVDNIVASA